MQFPEDLENTPFTIKMILILRIFTVLVFLFSCHQNLLAYFQMLAEWQPALEICCFVCLSILVLELWLWGPSNSNSIFSYSSTIGLKAFSILVSLQQKQSFQILKTFDIFFSKPKFKPPLGHSYIMVKFCIVYDRIIKNCLCVFFDDFEK